MSFQIISLWENFWTLIARVWFLACVHSLMFLQIASYRKVFWHWLQGYGFWPMCIFKCIFRLISTQKIFCHWLQGYGFHLYVSSYDISNKHLVIKLLDIDSKGMVSCLCVFSNVSSYCYFQRKPLDIDCKGMVSQLCVLSNVFSEIYVVHTVHKVLKKLGMCKTLILILMYCSILILILNQSWSWVNSRPRSTPLQPHLIILKKYPIF